MSCNWSNWKIGDIKEALEAERRKTADLERLVKQLIESQAESNKQQKDLIEAFSRVSGELKLFREELYPTVASTKPGLKELKKSSGGSGPAAG